MVELPILSFRSGSVVFKISTDALEVFPTCLGLLFSTRWNFILFQKLKGLDYEITCSDDF